MDNIIMTREEIITELTQKLNQLGCVVYLEEPSSQDELDEK